MIKGNNLHVFFHIWHAYLPPFAERLFCINHMECCYCMKLKSHSTHEKRQNRTEILERFSIAFTANGKRQAEISLLPKTREINLVCLAYILPVSHSYGASTTNREIS